MSEMRKTKECACVPEQYQQQVAGMIAFLKTSCAFTGHRPKKLPWRYNEDDPACVALRVLLAEQIAGLAERGFVNFLSGMAEAVDSWCALSALALREEKPALRLHCIIPHKSQADQWSAASRERHRAILEQADSIWYVNRENTRNCMMARNRALIDYSNALLAVYNGEQRDGTAATVRYARKLGRSIILIDPLTLTVTYENYSPEPAQI